jgi:hypothetical protein
MQIALVTLSCLPPDGGNLFAETYVGVENILANNLVHLLV